MISRGVIIVLLLLPMLLPAYDLPIKEASGVACKGDTLYIVGDDNDGMYFVYPLKDTLSMIQFIEKSRIRVIVDNNFDYLSDLEGIEYLDKNHILLLSEDLAVIHLANQIHKPHSTKYVMVGGRGLEGLAYNTKTDQLATLWEGGYLDYVSESTPDSFSMNKATNPIVSVDLHFSSANIPRKEVILHPPIDTIPEPEGMRYRGTDLVWHNEGFIVLLAAFNNPADGNRTYGNSKLMRFDMDGNPVGEMFDLHAEVTRMLNETDVEVFRGYPKNYRDYFVEFRDKVNAGSNINFEGMDWFREGQTVVLVYDAYPMDPTMLIFVDIPDGW